MYTQIIWAVVKVVASIVVSYAINQALASRSSKAAPEAVSSNDWDFPQSDEGTPQCVIFGDCWTEDWQVLSYGNYRTTEIKKG
ncbi:hypothetical protein DPW03_08875 [Aggregatibacter aphrophilus]|jgi:hypothetical protein|uniref:hypothetical protein n=1 Tax=Aggregatibacter kilianii TaxID=2025884 RepID=UPI000D646FBC|nr:hypothetical protein [Aggregatibacter kilianii]RDE94825.1 hypothetical protein DPW03_08875 [Aggregatibacter aphrophilus]DAW69284.1 MAG TPA: hypothetical protein [Caudoviricetes sp.]